MGRCRVDWATYYTRTKELRRPDLKKVARRAMIAEVVARHRAILLAEGTLIYPLRKQGDDPDVPWEGVPCTHLNDDRRIPLLWTKGGVAQTLVNPCEPFWYRLEDYLDSHRVPDGKMFKDFAKLDDMGPEIRAQYQHCGLVPEFPAAPVEEVRRKGSGGSSDNDADAPIDSSLLIALGSERTTKRLGL